MDKLRGAAWRTAVAACVVACGSSASTDSIGSDAGGDGTAAGSHDSGGIAEEVGSDAAEAAAAVDGAVDSASDGGPESGSVVDTGADSGNTSDAGTPESATDASDAAAPTPALTAPVAGHDFGTVATGVTTPALSTTVTNGGTGSAGPLQVALATGSDGFTLGGSCASATVSPGGTCSVTVTWVGGATASDTVIVRDPGGDSASFGVSGTDGGTPSQLTLDERTQDAGTVSVGSTASVTFTASNASGISSSVASFTIDGDNGSEFSVDTTDSTCKVSQAIPNATSCTVVVQFSPSSAGSKYASVGLHTGGGRLLTMFVTGTAM